MAVVVGSMLAAAPGWASGLEWSKRAEEEGVTVYTREAPGSRVREVKAEGVVDAPPQDCFHVVTDFAHYASFMPYTQESRVVRREGRAVYFYTVIAAPLVSARDYTIRVEDDSRPRPDGSGYHARWSIANSAGPSERDGVVRVTLNSGQWTFQPLDGGRRTRVTYQLLTDPGGAVPTWIANRVNVSSMRGLFRALRKAIGTIGQTSASR